MLGALFYLQFLSVRNRLVTRVTRLKQPKYLVGAIVGGLYFYYYFFRHFIPRGSRPRMDIAFPSNSPQLIESLGALILFVIVFLAWFLPHSRAALTFSEAEIAFLFPAPVSRRGLIHFKLARSQMRILFTVLFFTLITNRFGGNPWIHAAGWWLILSTLNLHFLGSSFARTLLLDRGISNWVRRVVVIGLVILGLGIVWLWAKRTFPTLTTADLENRNTAADYAQRVLTSGPALYLLLPFRLVVRPFLAANANAFLLAFVPALGIFIFHYFWVIYSNVAFEEASVEASQRLATKVAEIRAGNFQAGRKKRKGKRPWFTLAPTGPPAIALLWKNLLSAGQGFTWRILIGLVVICVVFYASLANNARSQDLFTALSFLIGMILAWSLLVGPQFLRQDFRQDLALADVLKTFPMAGWQVALGEILAPAALLAGFQWVLLAIATFFQIAAHGPNTALFLACIAGAAVLLPPVDMVLLLIPNAAVLLFPSWFQASREGPRGIEATGQRLVFFFGQLIVLAISLIPATVAFGAVFFAFRLAIGNTAAIPFASAGAALVMALEAGLGIVLVGKLFQRFDLSAEANP